MWPSNKEMADRFKKSSEKLVSVWTDDLGWHTLPALVAVFIRHGRFSLRFTKSARSGNLLATILRVMGLLVSSPERVQLTRHGEHFDDPESAVYRLFGRVNDFTSGFVTDQDKLLADLRCQDPRARPDRVASSLGGEIGQSTYDLLGFLEFIRYWHKSNEIPLGQLVILSPSSILAHKITPGWAGEEDVEFHYIWSPRNSLILQAGRVCWHFLPMCLRRRRDAVPSPSMIATELAWGLDRSARLNDLFWWWDSGIPANRVLLVFDRADAVASRDVVNLAGQLGIKCVVKHPRAAGDSPHLVWRASPGPAISFRRLMRGLGLFLWGVGRGRSRQWAATRLMSMLIHSSSHEDLFNDFNVRAVFHHHEAGQDDVSLACDLAGAARIGIHWSHIQFPAANLPRLHQVYFAWGQHHASILEASDSRADQILISGCIVNGASLDPNYSSGRPTPSFSMDSSGVTRVLALFDQGSPLGNFYEFFLRRVLDDPRWGLLIKPKNISKGIPQTLRDHSPHLLDLYGQAVASGRIHILDSQVSPAEAAATADFSVGPSNLSAAVVAALAGNRVIHLDYPRLHSSPLAKWAKLYRAGPEQIVFDDPERLWESLNRHFDEPGSEPNLGQASKEVLGDIDPFRDGLAGSRIGEYLRWYLDGLDGGLERDSALEQASDRYAGKWGSDMVVRGNHASRLVDDKTGVAQANRAGINP